VIVVLQSFDEKLIPPVGFSHNNCYLVLKWCI